MGNKLKKIIIVDDKHEGELTGKQFMNQVDSSIAGIIEFHPNLEKLIRMKDVDEVEFLSNLEDFEVIFIHASYNAPLLNAAQLNSLLTSKHNIIRFSGEQTIKKDTKQTSRENLFLDLGSLIRAYKITGYFPYDKLYDKNKNIFYPLLLKLREYLEEGEELSKLIQREEFDLFLKTKGFSESEFAEQKKKYLEKDNPEFEMLEEINSLL